MGVESRAYPWGMLAPVLSLLQHELCRRWADGLEEPVWRFTGHRASDGDRLLLGGQPGLPT